MIKYVLTALLLGLVGCYKPLSPTIGEVCPTTVVSTDETYLRNNLTCVEMHKAMVDGGMNNWTVVYIVGLDKSAAFEKESDAMAWARSQPYVRWSSQVR